MADAADDGDGETRKIVLRVKRKYTEDPVDALLIAHSVKRQHIASPEGEKKENKQTTVESLFRLVGTVSEDDQKGRNEILQRLKEKPVSHQQMGRFHKKSLEKVQNKLRNDKRNLSQEARFKIVSKCRPSSDEKTCSEAGACSEPVYGADSRETLSSSEVDDEVQRLFNVYDVMSDQENKADGDKKKERQRTKQDLQDTNTILCNSTKMIREKLSLTEGAKKKEDVLEAGYVYDLYTTYDTFGALGDMVQIMPVDQQDLVFETMEREFEEIYDDEDDSNDEDNWRNDYPDHDPWESDPEEEKRYFGNYGFDSSDDNYAGFGEDLSSSEESDRIYLG